MLDAAAKGSLQVWYVFRNDRLPPPPPKKILYLCKINIASEPTQPLKNKPSFCSGSCNEIHATTLLQWKIYWNILETPLKLPRNIFWTSFRYPGISLEPPWMSLRTPSIFLKTSLKYTWNRHGKRSNPSADAFCQRSKFPQKIYL